MRDWQAKLWEFSINIYKACENDPVVWNIDLFWLHHLAEEKKLIVINYPSNKVDKEYNYKFNSKNSQ